MKKTLVLTGLASALLASAVVHAEDTPDNQVSFNAAVTSDYRYRGISQTRLKPAVQGGIDYTNAPSGFYLGAWASTIKWIDDLGGDAKVELDIYGGFRGEFADDFTWDVGLLRYQYQGNDMDKVSGWANTNTTEVYGQLGYGPAYIKYSHSTTDLFGTVDSKGSGYLDVGANFSVYEGGTLNLHVGSQTVENFSAGDYEDWKVGLTHDFGVVVGSIAYVGTNADEDVYYSPKNGKFLGRDGVVVTVSKTF
jgi:uncharacterized protein (TIGR02001 family)